jgi:hypothetical protein
MLQVSENDIGKYLILLATISYAFAGVWAKLRMQNFTIIEYRRQACWWQSALYDAAIVIRNRYVFRPRRLTFMCSFCLFSLR